MPRVESSHRVACVGCEYGDPMLRPGMHADPHGFDYPCTRACPGVLAFPGGDVDASSFRRDDAPTATTLSSTD
jgi:hypothetical protein